MSYQFDPPSFVLMRYCTKDHSYMRICDQQLSVWLQKHGVEYVTNVKHNRVVSIEFMPPAEWDRYIKITPELAREIKPFALVTRPLIFTVRKSVQLMKWHDPLSIQEYRLLNEVAGISPL